MSIEQVPLSPANLTPGSVIAERLAPLIGTKLQLTGKTRTDGSNLRKMIEQQLSSYCSYDHDEPAVKMPEKQKGVPRIKGELLDSYMVTGDKTSYNLQVWNRIPNSEAALIEYDGSSALACKDVRYVLVRVNPVSNEIDSIVITTASYIEDQFGVFGVPTIKWQLIISESNRNKITQQSSPILSSTDAIERSLLTEDLYEHSPQFMDPPKRGELLSIESMRDAIAARLIGSVIDPAATKNRGQNLEAIIINALGYKVEPGEQLAGGYPDLPNQALEIKIQDSPTVDLGKYSPQVRREIFEDLGITTQEMRYLIVLTNESTHQVEGFVLCPGEELENYFSYVPDKNYKCQRSIPMSFFDSFAGKSIYLTE